MEKLEHAMPVFDGDNIDFEETDPDHEGNGTAATITPPNNETEMFTEYNQPKIY